MNWTVQSQVLLTTTRKFVNKDSVCYSRAQAAILTELLYNGKECSELLLNANKDISEYKQRINIKEDELNICNDKSLVFNTELAKRSEDIKCLKESLNKSDKHIKILGGIATGLVVATIIETLIIIVR